MDFGPQGIQSNKKDLYLFALILGCFDRDVRHVGCDPCLTTVKISYHFTQQGQDSLTGRTAVIDALYKVDELDRVAPVGDGVYNMKNRP